MHTSRGTQAIETIRIGQRVITYLPHERTEPEPEEPTAMEWAAHRVITLLLPCQDEQWIRMQLLRDPDWFRMMAPEVGDTVFLDMPEMGVEGDATVEAIEPCPEIEIGEGRVVTATFHHSSGECLELDIEGEDEPLRVTSGHPIWRKGSRGCDECGMAFDDSDFNPQTWSFESIINRKALRIQPTDLQLAGFKREIFATPDTFTRTINNTHFAHDLESGWKLAGEIEVGEIVSTRDGDAVVAARRQCNVSSAVFNVEGQGLHVYRVMNIGVLVHNDSASADSDCDYCTAKGYSYTPTAPGYPNWTAYVIGKCNGSIAGIDNPHGHHIVMKAKFDEYTKPSRQILCKHEIDPYRDCRNLTITQNRCHSREYAKWVYNRLKEADDQGTEAVIAVLLLAAAYHKECRDPGSVKVETDE